ncbi:aminoglycoside phosphotransferase family protein [Pseudonocardia sp. TRM90224]|uniref:aminoglycoside phosphotransferase family protein n=1 Tax=Pseudonocardia sp. TRM90224 TaxID=2812678 RepID=UPI001E54ECC4|nr:aminoglycoside phosphotransferase family protein [Pseudonocardia sp. TRM90224]
MGVDLHADGRAGIDAGLVRRLIAEQFPHWSELPITPVAVDGWDNRTYRLGDELTVRLPTYAAYAEAVAKEDHWLPLLAPALPVPIPEPVGFGAPGHDYPHHWSVRRWIDGETAGPTTVTDMTRFAREIAGFITALQAIDPTGGPTPGQHCFHRGGPPAFYDGQTRTALAALRGRIDTERAQEVWEAALAAPIDAPPVWFHGDIASGNLLVRDGRLAAVIDFGTSGVGDPACDLVISWTMFAGESRRAFRDAVRHDDGQWARARGWAIWKALIVLADTIDSDATTAATSRAVIDEVIADHLAAR